MLKENKILLIRPEIAVLLKQGTKREVIDLMEDLNMDENEYAVIPVNDVVDLKKWSAGDHYSTLIYDIQNNNFFHLDSIAGKNNAHAKELAVNLLNGNAFNNEGKLNATFTEYKECGRQNNGYDCGLYVIHNMKVAVENVCVPDSYERHAPMDGEIKILRDTIREQIDREISRNEQKEELVVVSVKDIDELIASKRDANTIGDSNEKNNRERKGINNGSDNKQKAEASYVSQRRRNEDKTRKDTENEVEVMEVEGTKDDEVEGQNKQKTEKKENYNKKEHERKECYFWLNYQCKFGEKCRKEHPTRCQEILEKGTCRNGNNCKLAHPKICWNIYKHQHCARKHCWYIHPSKITNKFVFGNKTNNKTYQPGRTHSQWKPGNGYQQGPNSNQSNNNNGNGQNNNGNQQGGWERN